MRNDVENDETGYDSWMDWFFSRKSAPKINRYHKTKIFETFNAQVDDNDCKIDKENIEDVSRSRDQQAPQPITYDVHIHLF